MMRIAHIALWTRDLDGTALFWMRYFGAKVHDAYFIKRRPGFISRFVTLPAGDQIELMTAPRIKDPRSAEGVGRDHLAISLGEAAAVDAGVSGAVEQIWEDSHIRAYGQPMILGGILARGGSNRLPGRRFIQSMP